MLIYSGPSVVQLGLISLIALSSLALGIEGLGYPGLLPGHNLVRTGVLLPLHPSDAYAHRILPALWRATLTAMSSSDTPTAERSRSGLGD